MAGIEGEAIVLRAVEYGESDLIVRLLMPDAGRLTVMAKHARKSRRRFPGALDLFNHVRVRISRRRPTAMGFLEQANLITAFLPLRRNLARYGLASYLLELLGRMAPEEGVRVESRRIFDFALSSLQALSLEDPNLQTRLFFELRAFEALGLCPGLEYCVRCGVAPTTAKVGFHVPDGGPICASHGAEGLSGLLPVHLGTLRALQKSLDSEIGQLGRLRLGADALAEAQEILFRFYRFHVGFELKSEPFLAQTLEGSGLTAVAS